MNLIILQPSEVDGHGHTVLTDDRARHIRNVLRVEVGQTLRIGLLNGPFGTATVRQLDKKQVELSCGFNSGIPPRPKIDLLLAMPRPKVLKRMWAQLAALGVGRIVLLRADKVERYYFDSHVITPDFYNKFLLEGLQQARCTHLPEVRVEPLFKPYVEDRLDADFSNHWKILADPSGESRIRDFQASQAEKRVLLAVGPEGGWTPYELDMLMERDFELVGMGDRILRTDTATIALLSLLNERLFGR